MQGSRVQSLVSGNEESTCYSLEEEMATHSSRLAWRIPMDRGAWWAYSPGSRRESDTAERLKEKMLALKIPNINTSVLPGGLQKGGSDSRKGVSQ